jgi:hypothetical protein
MNNPFLSFYLLKHQNPVLVALALAHVGRSRSRAAGTDAKKHRASFTFYVLSFLVIALVFIMRLGIR